MERALNRDALHLALGEHERLPSADELQQILAQAEVNLFLHRPRLSDEALAVGWYLHGVASSPAAYELYFTYPAAASLSSERACPGSRVAGQGPLAPRSLQTRLRRCGRLPARRA